MDRSFFYQCRRLLQELTPVERWGYSTLYLLSTCGLLQLFAFKRPQEASGNELALNGILLALAIWLTLKRVACSRLEALQRPLQLHPACQAYWEALAPKRQRYLAAKLQEQASFACAKPALMTKPPSPFLPFAGLVHAFQGSYLSAHPEALASKVAVLTLAGGQATRLKSPQPKGCLKVSPLLDRSLFEIQASYLRSLRSSRCQGFAPWAIMTSRATHAPTLAFFQKHDYFGLDPSWVDFFMQEELPLLDDQGRACLDEKGDWLSGPDGNGGVLHHLVKAPFWDKWKKLGLEVMVIVPVDNPLAYPFERDFLEPVFQGLASAKGGSGCEKLVIAAATTVRSQASEKVGVFASFQAPTCDYPGRCGVAEYSEIDPNQAQAQDSHSQLLFRFANCGLFALPVKGVEYLAAQSLDRLPWHLAQKEYQVAGISLTLIKRERFIFDLLALWPGEMELVNYPRAWLFAPVKTCEDIEKSTKAIGVRDQMQLEGILSKPYPREIYGDYELSDLAWLAEHFEAIGAQASLGLLRKKGSTKL